MPLVRIDLIAGKSPEYRKALGAIVHKAMTDVITVPMDDRFQIICEHTADDFNMTPHYLGVHYSADLIIIQITLNAGRTLEMKQAFYKYLADALHMQLGVRREDVFINLIEVTKENWSFGNGEMQYGPK